MATYGSARLTTYVTRYPRRHQVLEHLDVEDDPSVSQGRTIVDPREEIVVES